MLGSMATGCSGAVSDRLQGFSGGIKLSFWSYFFVMEDDLAVVEEYASLDERNIYDDFESIVSDVLTAVDAGTAFTSGQLPKGFDSDTFTDGDFGFTAEKSYKGDERIKVNYRESSDIGFGSVDSSRINVEVEPGYYQFDEIWDQSR